MKPLDSSQCQNEPEGQGPTPASPAEEYLRAYTGHGREHAVRCECTSLCPRRVHGTCLIVLQYLYTKVSSQRKVLIKDPSTEYWTSVDLELERIRKKADGDSKAIARYVNNAARGIV